MTKSHIDKAYDSELRLLRDRILLIAGRVEKMIANSMRALAENNADLARATIEYDKTVDRDEMVIDRQCLELLAIRQPLGQDLRFIVAVIKMVTYFERLGDLAVKICQRVLNLKIAASEHQIKGLLEMASGVQFMIKETVESLLIMDDKKAMQVIRQDHNIDDIYHSTIKLYIKEMTQANHDIEYQYNLLSIAKWLERMGDHCTNLAELIIFMIRGEDVRHKAMANIISRNG